jgi:hypothetical protein
MNFTRLTMNCNCGSGLPKEAQYDARGIFLTYTCKKCEQEKLSQFRPDVLTEHNYWHDEPIDEE